jgi:hypothetical protein
MSACGETDESAPLHVDNLRKLAYVKEIRIGSADDPLIGFSRIRRVRLSDKGDVYVLDASAREVRVFSSEGERLRVIGGPGEGPGEFSLPADMGLLGDTLWVADGGRRRLTWFGPNGDVLLTMPAQEFSSIGRVPSSTPSGGRQPIRPRRPTVSVGERDMRRHLGRSAQWQRRWPTGVW